MLFTKAPLTCGGHTNSGSLRRVSLVGMAQRGGLGASCRKRCFTASGILASRRLSALIVTHVLQKQPRKGGSSEAGQGGQRQHQWQRRGSVQQQLPAAARCAWPTVGHIAQMGCSAVLAR